MHSIVISYYLDFKLLHGSLVPFILAIFSSPLDSTYTPPTTFNALTLFKYKYKIINQDDYFTVRSRVLIPQRNGFEA